MKTLITCIFALALIVAAPLFADQDEKREPSTLFGSAVHSFSGYGGLTASYARLDNNIDGWLVGGRGGVILNDRFVIGGGGKALIYPTQRDILTGAAYAGENRHAQFGYGGLFLEYFLNPKDMFHISVGVLGGAGGIGYSPFAFNEDDDDFLVDATHFWVVEPEVNLYINLTRFCRIGTGVSYRYIQGLNGMTENAEINSSLMTGLSGNLHLHFGWF